MQLSKLTFEVNASNIDNMYNYTNALKRLGYVDEIVNTDCTVCVQVDIIRAKIALALPLGKDLESSIYIINRKMRTFTNKFAIVKEKERP